MMGFAITLALCLLIPIVQAASMCAPGFCQNGGTCSDFTGSPNCARCSCPANFTGDKCEKDVDECAVSDPCKNRATCINFYGGYTCRCINGWEGSDCSINTDDCATSDGSSKCLQGGSCIDRVRRFYCLCPPNYTGPICQYENECLTLSPCYGDAKCFTNGFGKYSCVCTKGWTGKNCGTDIDECAASSMSPCHQGGTCVNTPGHFVCQCPVGLTGERCEIDVNECASNPCQNGGVCLNHGGRYECYCKGGWTGQTCERQINECDSLPCQNGGQCHDLINGYNCTCALGYSGKNCETDIIATLTFT